VQALVDTGLRDDFVVKALRNAYVTISCTCVILEGRYAFVDLSQVSEDVPDIARHYRRTLPSGADSSTDGVTCQTSRKERGRSQRATMAGQSQTAPVRASRHRLA
jgi:hypothetical protein